MSHYEDDFYAWTHAQAAALRAKDWAALDLEHVAEEIESLGNEQRHAVRSHLRVLLWHLLKWAYQPDHSAYPRARRLASAETGLPLATFPEVCPWPVEQVLDADFWPERQP
jgi:hypothetical protein